MVTMFGKRRRTILSELVKNIQKTVSFLAVVEAATISLLYAVYTLVSAFTLTLARAIHTITRLEPAG